MEIKLFLNERKMINWNCVWLAVRHIRAEALGLSVDVLLVL